MRSLAAYLQIVNMGIQMIAAYRVQAILETASMLLQVFLLRAIWEAVYAGQNQLDGRPLSLVIAYVTIATIQNWLLSPNLAYFLAELVRDGSMGIELVRPVPFLGRLLAQQGGETAFALPFAIATFPLAVLLGGMLPPASPAAAALYVVSFGLGYGTMVLIGLMIGLASFWTIEIYGFVMIYRLVSAFFGGALIPLWFFPSQLSAVADWLPFQSMLFVPIAIYLGQLTGGEVARAIALQLLWILALYVRRPGSLTPAGNGLALEPRFTSRSGGTWIQGFGVGCQRGSQVRRIASGGGCLPLGAARPARQTSRPGHTTGPKST